MARSLAEWLRSLIRGPAEAWKALSSAGRADAEMDEEMRFHIQMETEKNIRRGMEPREARRQAMVAFGGVDRYQEQTREARGGRPLEDLMADLRFTLRNLRKSPGFTAVALLSLALGIGANTAVFSVVNAILLRDLPYRAPEELVNLYRDRERSDFDPLNLPDFREVQAATREIFSDLGGFQFAAAQREAGGGVEPLLVETVSGNYFPLLGIQPALGRTILPEDHVAPGAHPVVMLGYTYWQEAYGGSPSVIGETIRLSGKSYTIVGVAPRRFPGSLRAVAPHLFAPVMMVGDLMPLGGDPLNSRGWNSFFPVGRLSPGATLPQLRAALSTVSADLRKEVPDVWQSGDSLVAVPTQDVVFNPDQDKAVVSANVLALVMVALVLFIACANLASFLLARAVDRRKEVALRQALGAGRGRLIRQFLTETAVLGILAGMVGLPLSLLFLRLGVSLTLQAPLPLGLDLSFDWPVLLFTLGAALGAGLVVGMMPALQAARPELASTLRAAGQGGGGPGVLSLSRILVTGQVAVSMVLLVSAGLFLRSFNATRLMDPGFGREPTALASFMIPSPTYSAEEGRALVSAVKDEVEGMPQVTRVGVISNIHLNTVNNMFLDVNVDGYDPPEGRSAVQVDFTSVDEGFFDAAGIQLLEGRVFAGEDRADGMPVAVVNEAFARRFWAQGSPLGRTVRVEVEGFPDLTVVGVVSTAKIHSLGEDPTPFLYLPLSQEYNAWISILAVTPGDPAALSRDIYRLLRERHPELVVTASTTLEEHIGIMLILRRLSAALAAVLAALALGLAVMGLYGVVSYAVARRAREMGIRLSLGAEPGELVVFQLRGGLRLVATGGLIGLVAAWVTTRSMTGLLFGVSASDPLTFLAVTALLFGVATLAAWIPARRAGRVDPMVALKAE